MTEPITTAIALLSLGGQAISTLSGEVAGGETHNFVRKHFDQLKDNLNRHLPYLNHDLQRALRLAYLQATLQVCAIRLQEHGVDETKLKTYLRRRFPTWLKRKEPLGIFAQGEVDWLDKVCVWIEEEIRKLKSEEIPPLTMYKDDLALLMQPTDAPIAELKSLRGQLIEKVVDELKAEHGKLPDDFYSLMTKGWMQVNNDGTGLKQDWFDLFCLSFQHEAKKKNDIRIDFQNNILARLTFQNGNQITFDQVANALAQSNTELAEKLGEATKLLQERFDAGFENLNERFDELAPVLALADDIPSHFDSIKDLIRDELKKVHEHIDEAKDDIKTHSEEQTKVILSKFDSLIGTPKRGKTETIINPPIDLNRTNRIVGRDRECEAIFEALLQEGGGCVLTMVAPGGFGKTSLLAKVWETVTDGETIKDERVQRLVCFDFKEDADYSVERMLRELGRTVGLEDYFAALMSVADEKASFDEKLTACFALLRDAGNIWIALDNFEVALRDHYVKDKRLERLIESFFLKSNRFRVLVISRFNFELRYRRKPELGLDNQPQPVMFDERRSVGDRLVDGLDLPDAVRMLRSRAAEQRPALTDVQNAADDLLERVVNDLHKIPMAITSLVQYLYRRRRNVRLADLTKDENEWGKFKSRDAEEGLRKILRQQLAAFLNDNPEAEPFLAALAFFNHQIPFSALEIFGKSKGMDAEKTEGSLNLLCDDRLVIFTEHQYEPRSLYNIHQLLSEIIFESYDGQPASFEKYEDAFDEDYAVVCHNLALSHAYKARYRLAESLFTCTASVCFYLVEKKNRYELANDLAAALMNKAVALRNLGRSNEALIEYEKAIETYSRLVNEEGRDEPANYLAAALMNKAVALQSLGRSNEALIEYDRAIETYSRLVNEEGHDELANDLAMALMNKAIALDSLGRSNEALIEYDRAIEIRSRLVNEEGRDELANDLATALMNKGSALWSLGRSNEALIEYDRAIETYSRLVNEEGRDELANELAMVLYGKGVALWSLGRSNEALIEYEKAIETYSRLVNEEGRDELANYLAAALINKANALDSLGRSNEALIEYDRAIETYSRLVNEEGRDELANYLAAALMNKAVALQSLGRSNEALIEYDRAIETYSRLVNEEGRDELANDLAMALMNKAIALDSLGRSNEALIEYEKAIETYSRLVNEEGRDELANYLAMALMNKGSALWCLGRSNEALIEYEKAIEIRSRLVNEEGRDELANDLAMALMNKGSALWSLEKFDDALTNYNEAVRLYEFCIRQGRWELVPMLLKSIGLRMETRLKLKDYDEAAKDTSAALGWYLPFIENAETHEDLKQTTINEFADWVVGSLHRVSAEERKKVYKHLSEEETAKIKAIMKDEG